MRTFEQIHEELKTTVAQVACLVEEARALAGERDDPLLVGYRAIKLRTGYGRSAVLAAHRAGKLPGNPNGPRGQLIVRQSAADRWALTAPYRPRKARPESDEWAACEAAQERKVRRLLQGAA